MPASADSTQRLAVLAFILATFTRSDLQNPLTLDSSIYSLEFLESVEESLAKEGILVSQAGIAPRLSDPDETYSRHSHRAKFINGLTNIGFESIMTYDIVSAGLSYWGHHIDRIKLTLS